MSVGDRVYCKPDSDDQIHSYPCGLGVIENIDSAPYPYIVKLDGSECASYPYDLCELKPVQRMVGLRGSEL